MADMMVRVPISEQDPKVRATNFEEVCLGYTEEEYPYWVRDDGVKMLGSYVMVAASYNIRPKGTIVQSSLGAAIVCDTGGFAYNNPTQLDIATSW
jgi:3D (Asp-Asp-Asp) domain-containing protein